MLPTEKIYRSPLVGCASTKFRGVEQLKHNITIPGASWVFQKLAGLRRTRGGYAINVGARDGQTLDPVYELYAEHGWRGGLAIEADPAEADKLRKNLAQYGVQVHSGLLSPGNVGSVLRLHGAKRGEVDFMKMDIDNIDAFLTELIINEVRPKALLVEFNVRFPPPVLFSLDFPNTYTFAYKHGNDRCCSAVNPPAARSGSSPTCRCGICLPQVWRFDRLLRS